MHSKQWIWRQNCLSICNALALAPIVFTEIYVSTIDDLYTYDVVKIPWVDVLALGGGTRMRGVVVEEKEVVVVVLALGVLEGVWGVTWGFEQS